MITNIIREYYILTALRSAAAGSIAATYATFLSSKGLNLFEVNLVNFVFFSTLFICEIPTGAFADVFGRKRSYIIACMLFAVSMVTYAMSETIFGFVGSEILAGIASTFASGAFRAWFVDKLHHHGYEGRLDVIFAKASKIGGAAGLVSALIGSYLGSISLSIPWLFGGVFYLVGGILACMLSEEYFIPKKFSWKDGAMAMQETVKSSIRYGINNANVRFILLIVSIQILCVQAPNMQWQPIFSQHMPTQWLGYVWIGVALSLMLGNWMAPFLLKKVVDERKTLALCQMCIGIGILAAGLSGFPMSLVFFFFHEMARGACNPIKDAYLHDNIPAKERATIESFESIAHHGGGMIGLVASGFLALKLGISLTWIIFGGLLVVSSLLVIRNGRKK